MQNIGLIKNSRTAWPTKILMSYLRIFFPSLSDNMPQDSYFQNSVDNFEKAENAQFWFEAQFPFQEH